MQTIYIIYVTIGIFLTTYMEIYKVQYYVSISLLSMLLLFSFGYQYYVVVHVGIESW